MLKPPDSTKHKPEDREARCPNCGCDNLFKYGGEQHWPKKVAEAAGLPTIIRLWVCSVCHSHISELDLGF